jgi:mRNA-degrading endonuclease RelE of RelBE toxin-antitoxin system
MEFIETPTFTRLVLDLMEDVDYAAMQQALFKSPSIGSIIPGSGGIRKMRWAGCGRGKRGGLRVIYYWQVAQDQIWLLLAYAKNKKDDLTRDQIKQLRRLVDEVKL